MREEDPLEFIILDIIIVTIAAMPFSIVLSDLCFADLNSSFGAELVWASIVILYLWFRKLLGRLMRKRKTGLGKTTSVLCGNGADDWSGFG